MRSQCNLQFFIPFFDGDIREARLQVQQSSQCASATDAEIQFEQRALNERLSQLSSQESSIGGSLVSLDEQAVKLTEQLASGQLASARQKTAGREIASMRCWPCMTMIASVWPLKNKPASLTKN